MGFPLKKQCQLAVMFASAFLGGCGGGGGGGSTGPSAQLKPPAPNGGSTGSGGGDQTGSITPPARTQGNSYAVSVADLTNVRPSGESTAEGSTTTTANPVPRGLLPVHDLDGNPTGGVQQDATTTVSISGGNITPINSVTLRNCEDTFCYEDQSFSRETSTPIDANQQVRGYEFLNSYRNAKTSSGSGSNNSDLQSSYYGVYLRGATTQEGTRDPTTGDFVVNQETAGHDDLAFFHGGDPTSSQQMASLKSANVTAQYNGNFMGVVLKHGQSYFTGPDTGVSDVSGDVGMTANFGNGTVAGNVYNMQVEDAAGDPTAGAYGLRMDGRIRSGSNTYSGTTAYTAAATSQGASAVGPARGDVIGGFYGANAAETTGVARITGAPTGTATQTLIGSFGAKKQ